MGAAKETPKRTIPCKTPANANSCYWTRGRLREGNGNPSYRLWEIGTHRLMGIYSGPAVYNGPLADKYPLDNEGPEFPLNVERDLIGSKNQVWANTIYADFEICPLEPEKPEAMQAACIESAKNLYVEKTNDR